MRKVLFLAFLLAGLALVLYGTFFAPPSGRELLARTIAAHGGEAQLQRSFIGRIKGTGTKAGAHDMYFPIFWEEIFHQPDKLKRILQKSFQGQLSTMTFLYRDGQSWLRMDDEEPQVNQTGLGFNESIACPLGQLLHLYQKRPVLKTLEPTLVGHRFAPGLEVTFDDDSKVELYFDKHSHLLVLLRSWATAADGTSLKRERVFSDYRTVDGLQVPGKVQLLLNNRLTDELVVQEAVFLDHIDDSVFANP